MIEMSVDLKEAKGLPVIEVHGEVDVYTAPKLKNRISDIVDNDQFNIIVDLNGVEFMDSSGLGVLVGALKKVAPHNGAVTLILNRPNILKIFKITGLDKVFKIYGDIKELPNQ